ncbi:MAG: PDDEXK nuclease domain-containing protein [Candidatus Omnitrophica bacterium]|nr:PDDEXK nuclease domain-containing protein [Candidatus Omnitrophota bacterium]
MKQVSGINDYRNLVQEIKRRIRKAQYEALKAVNKELIALYWDIGALIVEEQKKHGWGKSIVENLAKDLQNEFPGMQGYSKDNIWRMRKFYSHYSKNQKLAPLVQEIGWTHNIIIMENCKDDLEEGDEFFIDILLYHCHLKCLVAIELKVGKFLPEYVGKMQFYLAVLDDRVRAKGENPSIGIIVCKSKARTIVEYALRESKKPIGVATYLMTERLPKDLRRALPSPEQISKLLEDIAID